MSRHPTASPRHDRLPLVSHPSEVVSEESADRDRSLKPFKYAQARIPHFWRVEDEAGAPTVHTYELDPMTSAYVATGIYRNQLKVSVPIPLDIDLDSLVPSPPSSDAHRT
jgi:hypothetical protein